MRYSVYILILVLLVSCRKTISIVSEIPEEDQYYLNGVIEVGKNATIEIGYAQKIGELEIYDRICDADIRLVTDNTKLTPAPYTSENNICLYGADMSTIPHSSEVSIVVNAPGDQQLTSECSLPESVNFTYTASGSFSDSLVRFSPTTQQTDVTYYYDILISFIPNTPALENLALGLSYIDNDINQSTPKAFNFIAIPDILLTNKPILIIDTIRDNSSLKASFSFFTSKKINQIDIVPEIINLDDNLKNYYKWLERFSHELEEPFVVPRPTENNISGGNGIFGSYNRSIRDTFMVSIEY